MEAGTIPHRSSPGSNHTSHLIVSAIQFPGYFSPSYFPRLACRQISSVDVDGEPSTIPFDVSGRETKES